MISNDPALRALTLAIRSYAVDREPELKQILQTASDPRDRRAAATLLGYVRRSPAQAEALSKAITDPDDEVRNNAVRALAVLSAATTYDPLQIDIKPLIDLLYSGSWTDRNKASLPLYRVTDLRNPTVLNSLRSDAMGPLIEGGSWKDVPGHSTPFLVILGRLAGMPDQQLQDLLKSGNANKIIWAAIAASDHARR